MDKKEINLLEACVISVIDKHAFDVELSNGHRFVAFLRQNDFECAHPEVGATVVVEMSPFDMSKGRLVID